jgi:tRNA(Ile)-lysidine synthase
MPGSGDPFLEQLYLAFRDLISPKRRVILAVSGGCDSMALMVGATRLSDRLNARFVVVTIEHGLRTESKREAAFVMRYARALGLDASVRALKLTRGPAVEERARQARYEALDAERRKRRFEQIATAHTASDQAETVLQRLARGSALTGAASILERRDRVIRPLLFATRPEVRQWLRRQRVAWVEDPMNEDLSLLRVRLRRRVLPALERATDRRVALRLARFARFASEDDALLQAEAERAFVALKKGPETLDAKGLNTLSAPIARRVLATWLRSLKLKVDGELVERMRTAVGSNGVTALPLRRLLKCRRGNATIVIE